MQTQSKWMRHKLLVKALLLASPFVTLAPLACADGPDTKGKAKQVPSYVAAQFEKPKIRSVHTNKANVRSGPADKYYATSTLPNGSTVDVYMETSDGWSGIRPPAGSHDWIPSNIAYLLPGGKSAEIIEDKCPAWVGSESSDVSEFMWQMELRKSQQVQVLGEELQLTEEGKHQRWYRIAPPPGEFRWIKTSQLSDSMPSPTKDQGVQLASYAEDSTPAPSKAKQSPPTGKVVWSDEQEALDQVDRQIKREQADIQRKMAADGVHVEIGAPKVEVKGGTPAKLASNRSSIIKNQEPESLLVVSDDEPSESGTVISEPVETRIRPLPAKSNAPRIKSTTKPSSKSMAKSTEHQIDGQRQWEAMQATDPKPQVKPLNSVLGLIGFSIIEAAPAPASTHIAQQYRTTPSQGNIGRVGPVGNSRLDRLPRPGQRASMTLPAGSFSSGSADGPTYAPMQSGSPMQQGESTFSRWINSREPVFGAAQNLGGPMLAGTGSQPFATQAYGMQTYGMQQMPVGNGMTPAQQMFSNGANYATQPIANPIPLENSAWHGLSPTMRNPTASNTHLVATANGEDGNFSGEQEPFRTPEIQSALVNLTQQLASPTEQWDLSPLRNQASAWVENGETAMIRGEARLLMERIERFEALRRRTLGLTQDASMIAQRSFSNTAMGAVQQATSLVPIGGVHAPANGNAISNAAATASTAQGDASGWLVQVHTSIQGQPEFALTDDAGKVITYVQSTSSLNLRRYLQQPVTVYGVRGYIPNLAAKQILAERVVRMR
jgi:SH3-like domain-containing protein